MPVVGFQIQRSNGHHISQVMANRYNDLVATKSTNCWPPNIATKLLYLVAITLLYLMAAKYNGLMTTRSAYMVATIYNDLVATIYYRHIKPPNTPVWCQLSMYLLVVEYNNLMATKSTRRWPPDIVIGWPPNCCIWWLRDWSIVEGLNFFVV
jgi:hypothetical protein